MNRQKIKRSPFRNMANGNTQQQQTLGATPASQQQNAIDTSTSQRTQQPTLSQPDPKEIFGDQIEQRTDRQEQLRNRIEGTTNQIRDLSERQQELEQQAGVPDIQNEVNELNTKIAEEQRARRERSRQIGDNAVSRTQAQSLLNENNREAAAKIADLEIIKNARTNNLERVRDRIDDKIAIETEGLQTELQNLRDFAQRNQNRLTNLQRQSIQTQIENRRKQLERERQSIQRTQEAVAGAVQSGEATREEVQRLSSNDLSRRQKQALARSIQARAVRKQTALERAQKRADIRESRAQLQKTQAEIGQIAAEATPKNDKQEQEKAASILSLVRDLKNDQTFSAAVGPLSSKADPLNVFTGEVNEFEATLEQLQNSLTLGNLDKLSGRLSDKDIDLLARAATSLRRDLPEQEFRKELNRIERTFEDALTDADASTLSVASGLPEEDVNEVEKIFGNKKTSTNKQ